MGTKPLACTLTVALTLAVGGAKAAEDVTFVLNWVAGGDHAPVYWAKEQGWYQDAGINLTIEEGRGSAASVQKVAPAPRRSGSRTWRPAGPRPGR